MRLLKVSRPVDTRHLLFSGGALAFLDAGDHLAMVQAARTVAEDLLSNTKHARAPLPQGGGEVVAVEGGPRFVVLRGTSSPAGGGSWRWLTRAPAEGAPYVAVMTFQEANLELGSTGTIQLHSVEDAEGETLQ